jgi:hypothetical protein
MVISNRPPDLATFVACLPFNVSFANPQVDSVQVHTEVTQTTEKARKEHAEPTDLKSQRSLVITF